MKKKAAPGIILKQSRPAKQSAGSDYSAGTGPEVSLLLNGEEISVARDTTIYDAAVQNGACFARPEDVAETSWIHNGDCYLLSIAEVNQVLMPVAAMKKRPVAQGMRINTESPKIKASLRDRVKQLHERQECAVVRQIQELCAAEAESAGFVSAPEREKWGFADRLTGPSILHEPNKCLRCEACVNACKDLQGVDALRKDPALGIVVDETKCVRCGQCILACPMGSPENLAAYLDLMGCHMCPFSRPLGAMREQDDTARVLQALNDPDQYVVVQFAPSVRATLGEAFGIAPGALVTNQLYAALRRAGFDRIWDTNFAADLTIMEEGSELIARLQRQGPLPQLTSCSPGWVNYIETFYPELLPLVSSAKSPQQMFGVAAKTYAAEKLRVAPGKMTVVSIMPCTAKKYEAARKEMNAAWEYWRRKGLNQDPFQDVDVVLTTREAAKLLKILNIDVSKMPEEGPDPLLGAYSGAAPIFGRTGGVMEAALRTAYELLTNTPLGELEFSELGTVEGIKRGRVLINGSEIKVAVAHGLANARQVLESIKQKGEFSRYHFIEIMCCPGGCVGGGGQIVSTNLPRIVKRTLGINQDDRQREIRKSHQNKEIQALYRDFLGQPLSRLAHELLHTKYSARPPK
ncbi:MAG: [FeFe] hydrogenase, group A [candidate division FCPU426 bacterium]